MSRTEEIKKRVEAATEGPWYDCGYRGYGPSPESLEDRRNANVIYDYKYLDHGKSSDGQFISHAREDIPWLLARVSDLEGKLERALLSLHFIKEISEEKFYESCDRAQAMEEIRKQAILGQGGGR